MTAERAPPRLRSAGDSPSTLVEALELSRRALPTAADLAKVEAGVGAALMGSGADADRSPFGRAPRRRWMRPVAAGAMTSFKFLLAAAVAASGFGAGIWLYVAKPKEIRRAVPMSPTETQPLKRVIPFEAKEVPPERAPKEKAEVPKALGVASSAPIPKSPLGAEAHSANSADAPVGVASFVDPDTTEVALLGRAEESLASDPGTALALTAEHARSFPRGTLAQEREFIAIVALDALGRRPEAVTRAARFRAEYPTSAHLRRLDPLLETPPADVVR